MAEKKTDAWMPLWIGAYLADTTHLSRDEHGGYLLLLMAYWRARGPLPDDDKRLAAITKATPMEWRKLRPVLAEFFTVTNGTWRQKRIEIEMATADARSEKAANKAAAAAHARWEQHREQELSNAQSNASSIPSSNAQAMLGSCPTPTPIPEGKNMALGAPLTEPPASPLESQKPFAGMKPPATRKRLNGSHVTEPPKSGFAWNAYAAAYRLRYGTDPVRNSKSNALLCKLVERLGADEAPQVAGWYVRHQGAWYVKNGHALDYLLRDAEKLRTEWATGRTVATNDMTPYQQMQVEKHEKAKRDYEAIHGKRRDPIDITPDTPRRLD